MSTDTIAKLADIAAGIEDLKAEQKRARRLLLLGIGLMGSGLALLLAIGFAWISP